MNIGQAAKQSGLTAKMIRNYENIGLVKPAQRTESGYRIYSFKDIEIFHFIHRARMLGFSIEDIKLLLNLWGDQKRSSFDVKNLAVKHVNDLKKKMAALQAMIDTLNTLVQSCSGDGRPDCSILKDLAGTGDVHH